MTTIDQDCEICGGSGRTFVDVAGPTGEHATADIDCPECVEEYGREDPPLDEDDEAREVRTEQSE